ALIVWEKPNLLLLDEPTNHLDIDMREAVAEALQDFDGTLVVVAHDRHLLKATTDTLWLVADGKVAEFDGDLDDYKQWARSYAVAHQKGKTQQTRAVSAENGLEGAPVLESGTAGRKAQKRADAEVRRQSYAAKKPLEDQRNKLEKDMAALNREKGDIEAWLSQEDAYADENKATMLNFLKRQGEVADAIATLEWKWLEVQQKLEEAAA
ncbi:MAG: ABC transporter, partial [Betaproteobacteria bacterium]